MKHRLRFVLVFAALVAVLGLPAARADISNGADLLTGRVNVVFAPGTAPAAIDHPGVTIVRRIDDLGVVTVDVPAGIARAVLASLPGVVAVEPDVRLRALVSPGDSRYGEQYGPQQMGFPAAWAAVGHGSSDVVVAVLDTGLRKTHQDFQSSRIRPGRDYSNGDSDPNDDCGHGTHVAGTVAATTDNGVGVAGMSQATILPMKVLSPIGFIINVTCSGSTSDIAAAIVDSTDQGAKVISMSLGGGGSTTLRNAVDYAWNHGVLVVAASGNDGGNDNVSYPAAYDNAIAVGALTSSKTRASYSDGGPELDVMAPGSNVISTYNSNDSSYSSLSGTSMATPHVAGALALAAGCNPDATNVQLRDALYATAEDLGPAGRDDAHGHGLVRADALVADVCNGIPDPDPTPDPGPSPDPDPTPDPDPSTPTIDSGQSRSVSLNASETDRFFKVAVPAGASKLVVTIDGPSCGLVGCSFDADLSTRPDARPTDSAYACRPYRNGSDETCTHAAPTSPSGYWYLRVNRYSGSGTVTVTATVS